MEGGGRAAVKCEKTTRNRPRVESDHKRPSVLVVKPVTAQVEEALVS